MFYISSQMQVTAMDIAEYLRFYLKDRLMQNAVIGYKPEDGYDYETWGNSYHRVGSCVGTGFPFLWEFHGISGSYFKRVGSLKPLHSGGVSKPRGLARTGTTPLFHA